MLDWFDINYKNQAINKDLSLAKIELILTNVVIVIIVKGKIKNFRRKGVIYTIPIASKYGILLKSKKLRGICLIILSLA